MAGKCVEKLPHSCGTREGLQVFEKEDGTYDGYCYSCKTYVPDPYQNKPEGYKPPALKQKTPEEIAEELAEAKACSTLPLPDRRLRKETLEYFRVKVGVKGEDGITPSLIYFPYTSERRLSGCKVRLLEPKRQWSIGHLKEVDLFGWEQAIKTGSKTIYITEGEFDAVALYQIITDHNANTQYAQNLPAVVSLVHGASSAAKDIGRLYSKISKVFKEIVLVFDMDGPGRKAVEDVMSAVHRVKETDALLKTAELPDKDANECLKNGKSKACFNAVVFNAQKPKNTRLVYGSQLRDAARKEAEWGLSWPWAALTKATRGIRLGETVYIGAGVKMGKSEVVNALAEHLMVEHGWKVFMAKPEEANRKTYQMLVGKAAGRIFHDPNIPFDFEAYDKYEPMIGDKAIMVNLYQHLGWDTLKGDIREAVAEGAKAVIIDPITNLTVGMSSAEANEKLVSIAAELSAMAMDLQIVIFIFCHLKAPDGGVPHERGGKVFSTQFAGSRAMMRSCNYMLSIEGNKDPDLPKEERNIRTINILEDREFGTSARVPLYWDDKTGLFNEMER